MTVIHVLAMVCLGAGFADRGVGQGAAAVGEDEVQQWHHPQTLMSPAGGDAATV